ncbi:general substrate transporter [Fusarium tricinctum]|uniref:General substrate transporter n=1 Tax=Fusarium tricinctum TaxID=61284 RepID=A0A8K0RWN2_9HYPO|nr:general substrate transporter [Fusarium tricinctum]
MPFAVGTSTTRQDLAVAQAEAPQLAKVKWWTDPGMRQLYFYAAILCVCSATTGYDGSMLNTSQAMDDWQDYFGRPTGSKLGILNSIYQIGSIASFPFAPFMADHFGRKIPIICGCLIMIVGAFISAFTDGYGMYLGGRFLVGFGNSLAQLSCPVLLTEICHPQHRAIVSAIYNCLWNLGATLCAFIGLGTININSNWSWRSITLIQAVPSLIQITFIWWIPESPRWLMAHERHEQALGILAKYHANGDVNNATVQFEYNEIKDTIALEYQAQKTGSYLDFLRTRGNRYRLMLLISLGIISQYSGNALISNYSNIIYEGAGIKDQAQKTGLNAGENMLKLFVAIGCSLGIDKFGRRPLFLTATVGMLLFFLAWTIVAARFEAGGEVEIKRLGYPQIALIWLFDVCYSIAWSGLIVAYALEIVPFRLRARGLMIMNFFIQVALTIGNQTNPIALENLPNNWNFWCFYTVWIAVELVFVYFFYIETKGPTLEEIARIFDGDDANVAQINYNDTEKQAAIETSEHAHHPERKDL